MSGWFSDIPVLAARSPGEAAEVLREIGDDKAAAALEQEIDERPRAMALGGAGTLFGPKPWQHSAHSFGHIAPIAPGVTAFQPIASASAIRPDTSLKGQLVKITLDRLRVAEYPGRGMHRILFDFYARNQSDGPDADLHFNATYRVQQGQQAGLSGYPIFLGVKVGPEGLAFQCFTVNVRNESDEAFLDILESPAFRAGLRLTGIVQPAVKPFAEMAYGLTRAVAKRNRNVPVQDVFMGLDFSTIPGRARLAEGAYVVVQIPDKLQQVWDWRDWVYDPAQGRITGKGTNQDIPFNYFVFGVSRMEGGDPF